MRSKLSQPLRHHLPHRATKLDIYHYETDIVLESISIGSEQVHPFVNISRGSTVVDLGKRFKAILKLPEKIDNFLASVFLPVGFPLSVPPEYFRFQCWNLVQDCCSYLRGIMSTQAVLLGMGVGRSDVTAVQATIQVILLFFIVILKYAFPQ